MSNSLSPTVLKVRLDVVLALRTGAGVSDAIGAWLDVEPDADQQMGALLVEAIVQAVGSDKAMQLVILASTALSSELLEVRNGGL